MNKSELKCVVRHNVTHIFHISVQLSLSKNHKKPSVERKLRI